MFQLLSAIVAVVSISPSITDAPARPASCALEDRPPVIARPADVEYPLAARAAGLTGTTVARVTLSDTGKVIGSSIAVSAGSKILDEAAKRTVAAMTFAPEVRSCANVAGAYGVEVEFAG